MFGYLDIYCVFCVLLLTNYQAYMQYTINVRGRLLDLSQPLVMGILNATPDSFYSGSRKQTEAEIADRANQIVAEGGRIIDVGAFSTRPGADEVSLEEETERLKHALQIVRREQPDAIVSVDTYRPLVARRGTAHRAAPRSGTCRLPRVSPCPRCPLCRPPTHR